MALGFVVAGIIVYLSMRFEWRFAVSAIIANMHDIVIILGCFAFFQMGIFTDRAGGYPCRIGLFRERIRRRLRPYP